MVTMEFPSTRRRSVGAPTACMNAPSSFSVRGAAARRVTSAVIGVRAQPDRGQNRGRGGIGVDAVACSVDGEAVHQAAARDQPGAGQVRAVDGVRRRVRAVEQIGSNTFNQKQFLNLLKRRVRGSKRRSLRHIKRVESAPGAGPPPVVDGRSDLAGAVFALAQSEQEPVELDRRGAC